jgi:hypothetical protein
MSEQTKDIINMELYNDTFNKITDLLTHLQSVIDTAKLLEIEIFTPEQIEQVKNKVSGALLLKLNEGQTNTGSVGITRPVFPEGRISRGEG